MRSTAHRNDVRALSAIAVVLCAATTARADDLDLIEATNNAGSKPPPNIMWLFDNSTTMRNLICYDVTAGAKCDIASLIPRNVINGATVCESPALRDAVGPDITGDEVLDPYRSIYRDDATTFEGTAPYPIFDLRKASATDDQVPPWTIRYQTGPSQVFNLYYAGAGATTRAKLDNAIQTLCTNVYPTCAQNSRCYYSMRTQGYFWEPAGNACGAGDPLNLCPALRVNGLACTANNQCQSGYCTGTPKVCTARAPFLYPSPLTLGDLHNFYPPKNLGLIKAFRDAIADMAADARMGISDYTDVGSNGNVRFEIKPPCVQSMSPECLDGDSATACFDPGDPNLENYLFNSYNPAYATAPTARLLDNVGKYFTATTGVSTPICDYSTLEGCADANNFAILIADGLPSGDAVNAAGVPFVASKVPGITDGYFKANGSWADDVARALTQIDFRSDIDDVQNVITYTVSYGAVDPADPDKCIGILEDIATAGGGRCIPARNVEELRAALTEVLEEIFRRAYGYTAPSVPTTRVSGTASLANAVFVPTAGFPLWEGHMFGFQVCDEKLSANAGTPCTCVADAVDDVCVLDADGNGIAYDEDGNLLSRPFWDAALCLGGDIADALDVVPPDQNDLDVSGCYRSAERRSITTAVAANAAPADELNTDDQITFDAATVDSNSAFEDALAAADLATAQKVVNFYRGYDAYDHDGDGDTAEDRNLNTMQDGSGELVEGWWKLGDIFHSIPNVAQRPSGRGLGSWALTNSYKQYRENFSSRPKVILVGANDGMLHAFHAGTWDAATKTYDQGTGEELWAFVSPEMLPRLKNVCDAGGGGCALGSHMFMVDGSVMVRDVWTGGDDDKQDTGNADKWRSIAIYGHRDGGSTYVALDVTDIDSPVFLWQFPQPGSVEEALMGKSWLDTFPSPASIGPVREIVGGTITDRWVALVSGGFDRADQTGNALFMLDVITGEVLWKTTRVVGSATDRMRYSFPATPTYFADLGGVYPYMAGIIAADHGGQLWHIPTPAQALSGGKFSYTPQLFFSTLEDGDRVYPDGDALVEPSDYQRRPFFFAPTLTANEGKIRVIIGSGDRDQLIPVPALDDTIEGYLCNDQQRIYAIDVGTCKSGAVTRPCNETDLTEVIPATDTYAAPTSRGWYMQLPAGEKSATPYDIFNGFALYATFNPNVACGTAAAALCAASSQGEARLYARHYLTGKLLDWDGDDAIDVDTESFRDLGAGVPTAPAVSAAIGPDGVTPTIFAGASEGGQQASTPQGLAATALALEIMRFAVPRDLHSILH